MHSIIFTKAVCLFALAFFSISVKAQTLVSETKNLDWNIVAGRSPSQNVYTGIPLSYQNGLESYQASQLKLNDNEVVAIVAFDKKEAGVIRFNEKMQVKWQTDISGEVLQLYRFYEDLLVIAVTGKGSSMTSELFFINPENGSIKKKTAFYDYDKYGVTEKEVRFHPLHNKATNEYKLCIWSFDKKNKQDVTGIKIISYDKDFNVVANDIIPAINVGEFLDCGLNNNGDFILLSMAPNGFITAQAFETKTWIPKSKVVIEANLKNKSKYRAGLRFGTTHSENVLVYAEYVTVNKKDISAIYKPDFNKGSYTSQELHFDKPAKKQFSKEYKPLGKGFPKPEFKKWENMRILDIVDSEDRIIVLRESIILYHTQNRTHITTGDALLSIFDKEMKLVSNTIIPKKFVIPASVGMSSSLNVRDGKLQMISGTSSGGNRESLFAQVDLATGKVNVLEHLQKEKIRSRYPCEPRATVWFNNHFAVSYMDPDIKFGRIYRFQTNLQLYKIN